MPLRLSYAFDAARAKRNNIDNLQLPGVEVDDVLLAVVLPDRVVDGLLDRVDHALRLLAGLALALAARRLGVDELARARDLEVARRARVADLLDGYIVAELLLDRLS